MYDLIGDIHGHADELRQLLDRLGYENSRGPYRHPDRKAVFVGDFIDRGPQIRQVLDIVRPMVQEGHAFAVMGNHELNALAFHTPDPKASGTHLRPHSEKNVAQHRATIDQLSPLELRDCLDWFRSLPLWLEFDGFRVVHACWNQEAINRIAEARRHFGGITDQFLYEACRKDGSLYGPVETVLKGKEGRLPEGKWFRDKDSHIRFEIRTRWYLNPQGHTYRTYALHANEIDCDLDLDASVIGTASPYRPSEKPVFFGHYWLSDDRPKILADNVACVDYSVARGGFLCGYRWNGERTLHNEHFVWTGKDR